MKKGTQLSGSPKLAGGEGGVFSALPEPSSCLEQHPRDKRANPGQPIQDHSTTAPAMPHMWTSGRPRSHQVMPGEPWEWKKYLSVPFSSRNCRAFLLERRWGKTWWVVAANKFLFASLPCHFCHPSVTHTAGCGWRRRWGMEVVAFKSCQWTLSYFILKGNFYASKEASVPYPLYCFTSSFLHTETFRGPHCTQTTPAELRDKTNFTILTVLMQQKNKPNSRKTYLLIFQ